MGFFDQFVGGINAAAAAIWSALQFLWNVIVAVFNFLAQIIVNVFVFLRDAILRIGKFLVRVNTQFFGKILPNLFRSIRDAFKWIEARLQPIIKFLKRVRDWYDRLYLKYVAPIMKLISTMRKVLALLRLAGLKQADALDRVLGRIQSNIARTFLEVRKILNASIDLLNAVSNPLRLGRLVVGMAAGRRALALFSRVATGRPLGYWFPAPRGPKALNIFPWERSDALTISGGNPPASTLIGFAAQDPAFSDVFSIDDWPGVDVNALGILPFFDDGLYAFGDDGGSPLRFADVIQSRLTRGIRG